MRGIILFFSILLSLSNGYAQKYLNPKNIQIGTSIFYFPTLDFEEKIFITNLSNILIGRLIFQLQLLHAYK